MSMTKKDYEALATALGRGYRLAEEHGPAGATHGAVSVMEAVVMELQAENARFDGNKFREWVREVIAGERHEFTGKRISAAQRVHS